MGFRQLTCLLGASLAAASIGCSSDENATPRTTPGVDASASDTSTVDTAAPDTGTTDSKTDTAAPDTGTADSGTKTKICMVTDNENLQDRSYNQTIYKGVQEAATQFGWTPEVAISFTTEEQSTNLAKFAGSGCALIVVTTFLIADATAAAANANPKQNFLMIDYEYDQVKPNIWCQKYTIDQPSFLVGYVAASVTKTGKVGTLGGIKFVAITDFMTGFARGVAHYNSENNTSVKVLGWDEVTSEGRFSGTFSEEAKCEEIAKDLISQGADIIFPVAGNCSFGAAKAVKDQGALAVVGVDTDWTESAPAYKSIVLTSVLKNLDKSVVHTAKAVVEGKFTGGTHSSDLASGETDIAPFHDFETLVPQKVKDNLPNLRKEIMSGTLKTKP